MSPGEFMQAYERCTNTHEIEVLADLMADDAIYLFSNQTSHTGKFAVRKAIQANFDAIEGETYRIHGLKWVAKSEDVAACVYEFDWSGRIDGKAASGHGRGTTVIRRIEGRWKVAHEHLSTGRLD
jgi:ketosteroid isomerase-like protein